MKNQKMNKIKNLFEENFTDALKKIGIDNTGEIEFIIIPTEQNENYTTWDDLLRLWSTPTFKGIRLNYSEVVAALVKEDKNIVPFWIKIYYKQDLPIILEISQRFRKIKEILERKPNNEIVLFEIGDDFEIGQIVQNERKEALRILVFTGIAGNKIKSILGDEINLEEIKQILENHLKNYRFYPPRPNYQKQNEENYLSIVISQDYNTGRFSICEAENINYEIISDLTSTEAIDYYIENQMKNNICGMKIKR